MPALAHLHMNCSMVAWCRSNWQCCPLSSGCTPHEEMDLRRKVSAQQQMMKTYTKSKRGAYPPSLQRWDKMCVQNLLRVMKGHKRYTEPLTVREKIGDSTYILSKTDSKTWNASHHTAFPLSAATTDRDILEPVINCPPRTRRVIQNPVWLKN